MHLRKVPWLTPRKVQQHMVSISHQNRRKPILLLSQVPNLRPPPSVPEADVAEPNPGRYNRKRDANSNMTPVAPALVQLEIEWQMRNRVIVVVYSDQLQFPLLLLVTKGIGKCMSPTIRSTKGNGLHRTILRKSLITRSMKRNKYLRSTSKVSGQR